MTPFPVTHQSFGNRFSSLFEPISERSLGSYVGLKEDGLSAAEAKKERAEPKATKLFSFVCGDNSERIKQIAELKIATASAASSCGKMIKGKWREIKEFCKEELPDLKPAYRIKQAATDLISLSINIKKLVFGIFTEQVYNRLFGAAQNANLVASTKWKFAAQASIALKWIGVFSITTVPVTLWKMGSASYAFIRNTTSRIDSALGIIDHVGSLAQTVATFAKALSSIGAVSAASVAFTGPLAFVGSLLGIAGLTVTGYGMWQTYKYRQELKKLCDPQEDGSISDDNFAKAIGFLKSAEENSPSGKKRHCYLLNKHFRVNGKVLNSQLKKISQNPQALSHCEKMGVLKLLNRQITVKQISGTLSLIAGVINIIGVTVLFATAMSYPPLMPLGFTCIAIGAAVSFSRLIVDWVAESRFKKGMLKFANIAGAPPLLGDIELSDVTNFGSEPDS